MEVRHRERVARQVEEGILRTLRNGGRSSRLQGRANVGVEKLDEGEAASSSSTGPRGSSGFIAQGIQISPIRTWRARPRTSRSRRCDRRVRASRRAGRDRRRRCLRRSRITCSRTAEVSLGVDAEVDEQVPVAVPARGARPGNSRRNRRDTSGRAGSPSWAPSQYPLCRRRKVDARTGRILRVRFDQPGRSVEAEIPLRIPAGTCWRGVVDDVAHDAVFRSRMSVMPPRMRNVAEPLDFGASGRSSCCRSWTTTSNRSWPSGPTRCTGWKPQTWTFESRIEPAERAGASRRTRAGASRWQTCSAGGVPFTRSKRRPVARHSLVGRGPSPGIPPNTRRPRPGGCRAPGTPR